jgi:hypothetical protein
MGFILKQTERVVKGQRYRDAQMDEVVSTVNAIAQFLDGWRRIDLERRTGEKPVLVKTTFRAKEIARKEPE